MAPRRHEIMRVRESKVITIKTLGLNQEHISHFKRERERNANTGRRYSYFVAELNPLTAFLKMFYHTWGLCLWNNIV